MAESEFLRNIRVMKEKRERKLLPLGKDPIAEIEKCTLVKRNAMIEDQYQVKNDNLGQLAERVFRPKQKIQKRLLFKKNLEICERKY